MTASSRSHLGRLATAALFTLAAALAAPAARAAATDLDEVKAAGVLRHLGIPYANFVTGAGDGMDVELMQLFAKRLGVRYEYVKTDWGIAFGDLTGRKIKAHGDDIEILAEVPIKGDVLANGVTVIPWRQRVVDFGGVTFPNQVWLVSRADSLVSPIRPTKSLVDDIVSTKSVMKDKSLMGKVGTCLDPSLYDIEKTGAKISLFDGSLNELAPAIIANQAELTLLDVPDALVALQKWPGEMKIIGPVSEEQDMAPAFRKDSPRLRAEFDAMLAEMRADGSFAALVNKYYPFVSDYFPHFLASGR
jgi:ABC-type amino acid transport substrate-binding protein